jgi:hypothetical protein
MPPRPYPPDAANSLRDGRLETRAPGCTAMPMIQDRTVITSHVAVRHGKRLCFGPFQAILPN